MIKENTANKSTIKELRLGDGGQINLAGGLNLAYIASRINDNQCSDILNCNFDNRGEIRKRKGQKYLWNTVIADGPINGCFEQLYKGYKVFACGTKLYRQIGTTDPEVIYTGISNIKTYFFTYGEYLYIKNGVEFLVYDGVTVSAVAPYNPIVSINRKPDGSESTVSESWNMLSSGFREQFNADGTATVYKLSFTNLDADTVTAVVNAVTITEGAGLTVDRAAGTVTFGTAPVAGTGNVVILGHKTIAGNKDKIMKCTKGIEFSNRIFLWGNADLKNYYFVSGLTDDYKANYWPTKYTYPIGSDDKAVTGFILHYTNLLVFKEDMVAQISSTTGLDSSASFPPTYIDTEIGCDAPETLRKIDNNAAWLNTKYGVFTLRATLIENEKNIIHISENIDGIGYNKGLLDEIGLEDSIAVTYRNKYYIFINGLAYVLDFGIYYNTSYPENFVWLKYDNYNVSCVIPDKDLYYGSSVVGNFVCESAALNDFGQPINAYCTLKLFNFNLPDYLKKVTEVWITMQNNTNSTISIEAKDENNHIWNMSIPSNNLSSFNWNTFNWSSFSWDVKTFAITKKWKLTNKKEALFFQFKASNNIYNEDLSIISLIIKYNVTRRVK